MALERVAVRPIEHESPGARHLADIAHSFTSDAQHFYDHSMSRDPKAEGYKPAKREEIPGPNRRLVERAAKFSLDLGDYWASARETASDAYEFGASTLERFGAGLEADFKSIDRGLEKRLAEWEEATSPAAEYDPDRIGAAADALRESIRAARATLDSRLEGMRLQDRAEIACLSLLGSALTGLSEQIAERLHAIAAGGIVEPITMSTQTKQLIERAGMDEAGDLIEQARANMETELAKRRDNKARSEQLIHDRTTELDGLRIELQAPDLTAAQRDEATRKVSKLERDISRLKSVSDRLDSVIALAENGLAAASDRSAAYEQSFQTAASALANGQDLAEFWRSSKSRLFSEVDALLGKSVRKVLDAAFDSDLASKLDDFTKQLVKSKLDPQKLQNLASTLLQTLDAYALRTRSILNGEDSRAAAGDPLAIEQIADGACAPIAALRAAIAKELTFLFQNGAFESR